MKAGKGLLATGCLLLVLPVVASAGDKPPGECAEATLRSELLQRRDADQSARNELTASPGSGEALDKVLEVDADNTKFMRGILAACGWPKRSMVGEDAAKAAWLLSQHADMDPQYQVLAGQHMKQAVLAGEADARQLASLVDRNRRLSDQPQVYGMQYFRSPQGVIEFYDIVTPAKLDERRQEIGLQPFYCWVQQLSSGGNEVKLAWPTGVLFAPSSCGTD
ncbi:hypothetical protein MMG85_05705 [Pseudoxanthomonas sp. LH2527]|uniref:DUF6624 domain-containing protein n=1 Tax=Pseudoxanthomonas sp. LH2527 TaxID=2923249 RepID=UPI001F1490BE|nr:DUF6624 domain-containing protein [Pseudoxanthomonas sp. LH2527]MCH6483057.1 hypothetical protein [Pseudoxanthomonas sp. LH2527]